MEEQTTGVKSKPSRRSRVAIVISCFTVFFAAIALVTILATQHTPQRNQPTRPAQTRLAEVQITKLGFEPATISVKLGTKIIWVNEDSNLHQVAANPFPGGSSLMALKSEILNSNQQYEYIAATAGTFGYHDQMQPTVNGTIVVQK